MIKAWIAYALLIVLAIYCGVDALHTWTEFHVGITEANPLMAWVICKLGFQFVIIIKAAWIVFLAVLIYVTVNTQNKQNR